MKISDMSVRDDEACCTLLRQVHALHGDHRPDQVMPERSVLTAVLSGQDGICLAACEQEEMVGMCLMKVRRPGNPVLQPDAYGRIEDICVREDLNGRGIGRALYEAAAERARQMGLMVRAFNDDARGFYEHLGMTERSRIMEGRL